MDDEWPTGPIPCYGCGQSRGAPNARKPVIGRTNVTIYLCPVCLADDE
jgi:hypothetical protein